jgi:hypothetical protein
VPTVIRNTCQPHNTKTLNRVKCTCVRTRERERDTTADPQLAHLGKRGQQDMRTSGRVEMRCEEGRTYVMGHQPPQLLDDVGTPTHERFAKRKKRKKQRTIAHLRCVQHVPRHPSQVSRRRMWRLTAERSTCTPPRPVQVLVLPICVCV